MAVVETVMKDVLAAHAGLSAISGLTIWNGLAPERTASPYIVWTVVDEEKNRTFGGDQEPTSTLVQVTVFADTTEDRVTVGIQVEDCLNDYSGTINSVVVQHIFFDGKNDRYDIDDKYFQRNYDYLVHFEE